jgi:hypothetical protein
MRNKWASRKFWLSVAAFLGSIGASIAGISTGEKWVTIVGIVCGMLSAAIYAAVEAYTDGKNGTATIEHVMSRKDEEVEDDEDDEREPA